MLISANPAAEERVIRRAAARAGCRVRSLAVVPTNHGFRPIGEIDCTDGWGAARFLLALSEEDAFRPEVRDAALWLRTRSDGDEGYARALQQFVQKNVRFVRERGEVFTGPSYTLAAGGGDCDDHARLVYALARAANIPVAFDFAFDPSQKAAGPTHVSAVVAPNGNPAHIETTVAAQYGEKPFDAAARLGITKGRGDITRGSVIMSAADLPNVAIVAPSEGLGAMGTVQTSDISTSFLQRVKNYADGARANGADVDGLDFLAVWNAESGVSHSAKNPAGAYGINQIMNLKGVGWMGTAADYLALSADDQLKYVLKYYDHVAGTQWPRIVGIQGLYLANFLPALLAGGTTDPSRVILTKGGTGFGGAEASYYAANAGIDAGKKGYITLGDLQAFVAKAQGSARWKELAARYAAESGGPPVAPPAGPGGVASSGSGLGPLVALGFASLAVYALVEKPTWATHLVAAL